MESKEKDENLKIIKDVVQTLDPNNEVFKLTSVILNANDEFERKITKEEKDEE